ncbi:ABC transporter substrate-binding protein [Phreatobacter stygius]|uniref:Branched-chain amino acid ABC transporter substrate-binding protein n=1 Tax=Phreatobacter stygius TaxID=1940610 RepID=A0A4D7AZW3_9HYPH|nr:ABC transporter substrate-binding protein [Phreatobacter stygius]QCI64158.1 branched-chain amino acid ABC transporter substrate-binding protein [Phreatobacter stygius]
MNNFSKARRRFLRGAVAIGATAPFVDMVRPSWAADDIKVGFNGDLSASPSAQSGRAAIVGIQAALDDLNAKGGVLGRKLTLVVRDDLSQPPKSIHNMSELIDNERVVAVFGPTNSGNALAWKHIPNRKKIPVVGCLASATDITKPTSPSADNYMFRVGSVDRFQVVALTTYARKNPTTKVIGFLTETTGYGQAGLKDLEEVAEAQGIRPAASGKFGVADTDMTSQLSKLRDAGVDTVLIWAQGTPTGQLLRSMDKIGYFPTILTSWAALNLSFVNTAGPVLAEKPIFLQTVSEDRTPHQQAFFDRMLPKLDNASSFAFAVHAYDAAQLVAIAIAQAGSTEGSGLREALENPKKPYEGIAKTYHPSFTRERHEALGPADQKWTCWRGGKLAAYTDAVVASLKPEDFKG